MSIINEKTSRLFGKNIKDDLRVLEALKKRYSLDAPLVKKLQSGNKETYTKEVMTLQHGLNLAAGTLSKLEDKV